MLEQVVYVQLTPEYSSLVELATRLGYSVYLCHSEQQERPTRYRIDDRLGRHCESKDLIDGLAFMIKRDMLAVTTPVL